MDSTDRERLSITRQELHKILAHEELHQCAVLVLANKQDVKGSMSAAEISRHLNLTSIKKHKWQIQACCALTGEGYVIFKLTSIYSILHCFLFTDCIKALNGSPVTFAKSSHYAVKIV